MRLGPIFVVLVGYGWVYLASLAWALAGVATRREPRFSTLAIGLAAGTAGVAAAVLLGQRGGLALLVSFPSAFGTSLAACVGDYCMRHVRSQRD